MAKIVLHSEHLNRPDFVAFKRLEQTGQEKIFGKTSSSTIVSCLKNWIASSVESLILKNCEKPKSWKTSYTFG